MLSGSSIMLLLAKLRTSIQRVMPRYVPKVMKFGPLVTMLLAVIIFAIIAACVTTNYLLINFYSTVNFDIVKSDNPNTWTTLDGVSRFCVGKVQLTHIFRLYCKYICDVY
jgi:hypothetical protein